MRVFRIPFHMCFVLLYLQKKNVKKSKNCRENKNLFIYCRAKSSFYTIRVDCLMACWCCLFSLFLLLFHVQRWNWNICVRTAELLFFFPSRCIFASFITFVQIITKYLCAYTVSFFHFFNYFNIALNCIIFVFIN